MERKFGALSSSVNPQELSLTVVSVVKMIGLLIGSYASAKGIDAVITDQQLELIAQTVVAIITAGLTIVQSGDLLLGIFRKIASRLAN